MEIKLKKPLPEIKIGYLLEIDNISNEIDCDLYICMPYEHELIFVGSDNEFFWASSFNTDGISRYYKINKIYGIAHSPGRSLDFSIVNRDTIWEREEASKPDMGEIYYTIELGLDSLFAALTWVDSEYDNTLLERGLVFTTEEEAIEFSNKILESV